MKDHIFLMDALTEVDDDLIAQAENIRPKRPWRSWVAAAAALAIIIGAAFYKPNSDADPLIPTNPPVRSFLTHPAAPFEQGYVGNPYNEKAPSSASHMVLSPFRMALTAIAVEILPDTYRTVGQQTGGFRLVRMKFVRAINTAYSGKYFYCIVSEEEAAALNIFSTVVLTRMKQYGHSDHVLYNVTQDSLEAIEFPLIGGGNIFSFRFGFLDHSFPGTAKYIDEQKKYFDYRKYHLSETPTLHEFERYLCRGSVGNISETIYDNATSTDQEIANALEYVRPFENGIFIPIIDIPDWQYNRGEVLYRRYVNGYPTNEALEISSIDVRYYGPKFTEEDLKDLPDLTAALEKVTQDFDAGLITPGHIKGWEEMKYISHSIFAWYDKTDNGVYGVIRVSWCYHDNTASPTRICRDDQYFLVELGSDTLQPIEHNELLAMGGDAWHFIPGRYGYDDYGRKNPPYYIYF